MRLRADEAASILLAYVAECDYCGGVGRVQRTRRRKNGSGNYRQRRSVVWVRCPRCGRAALLTEAIMGERPALLHVEQVKL